jgi:thiamine biosynthesis lipoprotein
MFGFSRSVRSFEHHNRFEGVLGTALELYVRADGQAVALEAEARILEEIERLEHIYSCFNPDSELNRWQLAGSARVSPDLAWLLTQAEVWQQRTHGAFNPAAEAIQALPSPSPTQLEQLCSNLQTPLWRLEGSQAHKLTPLSLNFNALAKGHIADQACAIAFQLMGVSEVWVNLGGDLCHLGPGMLGVSIADPFSRADNSPPIARLKVSNQGLATSGHSWRGAHLFDPRSAQPVKEVVQATALAKRAATADVLATAFCVLDPEQSLTLADRWGVGCLIIDTREQRYANAAFIVQCKETS